MIATPLLLILACAAAGLMLGRASRRGAWVAAGALALAALVLTSIAFDRSAALPIAVGLLLGVVASVGLCFLPAAPADRWLLAAAINAGAWAGAYASVSDQRVALAGALALVLLFLPARWLASRGYGVAIKVLASWMLAIASLSIFVSMLATPGFKPDHMQ